MASCCIHCGAEEGELHASDCPELRQAFDRLTHERDEARAEAHEQARLLGMSAERELKLMAEVERLRTEYHETLHMAANQAGTIKQQRAIKSC